VRGSLSLSVASLAPRSIHGNTALAGGGIYVAGKGNTAAGATLGIDSSTIYANLATSVSPRDAGNPAGANGGGIYVADELASVSISGSGVHGNRVVRQIAFPNQGLGADLYVKVAGTTCAHDSTITDVFGSVDQCQGSVSPPPTSPLGADATMVSSVGELLIALSDASVRHVMLRAGNYLLTSQLSPPTRALTLEAEAPGAAVLDAQGLSRVINAHSSLLHLIGLNITGGSNGDWNGGGVWVVRGE